MNTVTLLEYTVSFLIIGTLASYLGGALFPKRERLISGVIATIALAMSVVSSFMTLPYLIGGDEMVVLFGFTTWDADLLGWIVMETGLVLALIVSLYSTVYMDEESGTDKFFPLLLLLMVSVIGLSFTFDLFNLYLFFELLSVASFALVAFRKNQWDPVEAGIKFLVMSATGSALILLGIALVYKEFGTLDLNALFQLTSLRSNPNLWLPISCFTVGFGIKAALFPLHTWLPDAHAEAPSGISAMLSGIVIEIGLFALLRIYFSIANQFAWGQVLIGFGVLTMIGGNVMALTQKSLKRMLAYSSVAQMGYIVLGIGIGAAYNVAAGTVGGIFHIVTHAFMKGLAFLCAGALIHRIGSGKLDDMKGAGWKMPVTAVTFTIAVMSLAGVPPFSGFMSKLLIYQSGIQSGLVIGWVLSFIAIFNSVFSLGYYLPAVGTLYSKTTAPRAEHIKEVPFAMTASMVLLALITLYLGVMPDPVRAWVGQGFALLQGGF